MLLTPKVLECMHFNSASFGHDRRTVINYEFDLYLDGNHKICLDGVEYPDTARCLIFRKPGQITSGTGNYNMYVLTLDFGGAVYDSNNIFRPVSGKHQPHCNFPELDMLPPVFHPYHFEELRELMEKLAECSFPNAVDPELQEQYVKEFILLALLDAAKDKRPEKNATAVNRHIKLACDFISKNFTKNISVKDISDHLHITENHLIKLFKNELNQTPNRYILELKLIHARYLILHGDGTLQQIAFACGFNTPSYFAKRFYDRFGVLPNELRKNKNCIS